ncbi:MAG: IPT/TIG domain-containing protein [Calditrichia bacterium]
MAPTNPTQIPPAKAAATITGITPTVGFLKDEIVINGSGFDTEPSFNMVRFGNKVGTVTAATATSLTVITPNVNDATVDVQVAVKGSEFWSNNSAFTFLPTLELLAEDINWANGIEVDDNNNVYIGARNDGQIIKIAPDGTRSVFADVPVGGQLRFGPGGYLYVCAVDENKVIRVSADGSSIEDYAFADAAVSIDWDAARQHGHIVSRDAGINVMDTGGNMTYRSGRRTGEKLPGVRLFQDN